MSIGVELIVHKFVHMGALVIMKASRYMGRYLEFDPGYAAGTSRIGSGLLNSPPPLPFPPQFPSPFPYSLTLGINKCGDLIYTYTSKVTSPYVDIL